MLKWKNYLRSQRLVGHAVYCRTPFLLALFASLCYRAIKIARMWQRGAQGIFIKCCVILKWVKGRYLSVVYFLKKNSLLSLLTDIFSVSDARLFSWESMNLRSDCSVPCSCSVSCASVNVDGFMSPTTGSSVNRCRGLRYLLRCL